MYPRPPRVTVTPGALADRWEGGVRPGHFAGVLTVVAKLLHLVEPDVAVFGQKDVQQATLVRAMVEDLDLPTEIVVAPIVREQDGLALSSRNVFLPDEARMHAAVLPRALAALETRFAAGERSAFALLDSARAVIAREPGVALDYLAIVDGATLDPVDTADVGHVALLAARVGPTRLLDNVILGTSPRIVVPESTA